MFKAGDKVKIIDTGSSPIRHYLKLGSVGTVISDSGNVVEVKGQHTYYNWELIQGVHPSDLELVTTVKEPDVQNGALKSDQDKLRYDLIPTYPLQELARVYTIGAKKYADNNWRKGFKYSRLQGALLRHFIAWSQGEEWDTDDGQHHLASVIWCAMSLLEFTKTHPELDDRIKEPVIKGEPTPPVPTPETHFSVGDIVIATDACNCEGNLSAGGFYEVTDVSGDFIKVLDRISGIEVSMWFVSNRFEYFKTHTAIGENYVIGDIVQATVTEGDSLLIYNDFYEILETETSDLIKVKHCKTQEVMDYWFHKQRFVYLK